MIGATTVAELIERLTCLNQDEKICFITYGRSQFSNPDKDAWESVCKEFDTWDTVGDEVGQYISGMLRSLSTI